MTALLELEGARIDQDGVPLIEGLSFAASGTRVGLVGDFSGLFSLLGGRAELVAGRVTLLGESAVGAVAAGLVGLARRDTLLPEAWDLDRYLVEGARLGGLGKREAKDGVSAVLGALELGHLKGRRISTLTVAERRAAALALALLDGPRVVCVEDPVSGLDDRDTRFVCQLVERAASGKSLVVSTPTLPRSGPEHALLGSAEQLFVLEAGTLVGQGSLDSLTEPGSRYLVSVTRNGRELSERLLAAGLGVAVARSTGGFEPLEASLVTELTGGVRLVVSLPEAGTTDPIVDAALAVQAPIVELVPLSRPAEARA